MAAASALARPIRYSGLMISTDAQFPSPTSEAGRRRLLLHEDLEENDLNSYIYYCETSLESSSWRLSDAADCSLLSPRFPKHMIRLVFAEHLWPPPSQRNNYDWWGAKLRSMVSQWGEHAIVCLVVRKVASGPESVATILKRANMPKRCPLVKDIIPHYEPWQWEENVDRATADSTQSTAILIMPTDCCCPAVSGVRTWLEATNDLFMPDLCLATLRAGYHCVEFGAWSGESAHSILRYSQVHVQ